MKIFSCLAILILRVFLLTGQSLSAQQTQAISLQKAIEMAVENNHFLKIKKLQIGEKQAKVIESRIKALPSIIAGSTWQYNQNLGHLSIEQGSFGTLPISPQFVIPLPAEQLNFELSEHKNFNAGVTLYQPVTQLAKIKSGTDVSKTELMISEKEKERVILQIRQTVERLFYGILIIGKQKEEATARLELAGMKLHDAETALNSGKSTLVNNAGLLANMADEEQKLLKLEIQAEDYLSEFRIVTGITSEQILLEPVDLTLLADTTSDIVTLTAIENNDLKIALLTEIKAEQAVKAARMSYLPDFGFMAGYAYQTGNKIYPEQNPFIGASFKWNLQDILANRQLVSQRISQLLQSREQVTLTELQVSNEIEKAMRKLGHVRALMNVARKAVTYRSEELKIQQEKDRNGLNTPSEIMNAKANLAKSEADLLAAQLNFRMAITELKFMVGRE